MKVHILITLSLWLLFFIRFIGFLVTLDLQLSSKQSRFKIIVLGWLTWSITSLLPFLAETIENLVFSEILFVLNNALAMLGFLYIVTGLLSYFKPLKNSLFLVLNIGIILIPSFLYIFVGFRPAVAFTSIGMFILYFLFILSILAERKNLQAFIGKGIKWIYGTTAYGCIYIVNLIYINIKGYSFGLYQSNDVDVIIVNSFLAITITLLIVYLFMQLEHSLSSLSKSEIKDKYSHDIGNLLQIIYSAIEVHEHNCMEQTNLEMVKQKCKESGVLISDIRKL